MRRPGPQTRAARPAENGTRRESPNFSGSRLHEGRPLSSKVLSGLGRDVHQLLDCYLEIENNAQRGEEEFLARNLRGLFATARRINGRRKRARRLFGKAVAV